MRYIDLDEVYDALNGYIFEAVAYRCKECKREFYTEDDTARFCPFCGGSNTEVLYEKKVELIDWG